MAIFITHARHAHNALWQDGSTGLMAAAKDGKEAVVRLLLERGAEVDKANEVCMICHRLPVAFHHQGWETASQEGLKQKGETLKRAVAEYVRLGT